jgi:hypothetical protein
MNLSALFLVACLSGLGDHIKELTVHSGGGNIRRIKHGTVRTT